MFFWFLNFRGHFEALNDIFFSSQQPRQSQKTLSSAPSTIVLLVETFLTVSQATQTEIICKRYAPEKLEYQLTTSGPAKLLAFHLLGFCLLFFFSFMLYVKKTFGLFVRLTWKMRVAVTFLLRDKLPPFKWTMLFYNLYSICNFTLVIESKLIVYLRFFHISMCIILSSHKSRS